MGAYINPSNMTKEEFLRTSGRPVSIVDATKWSDYENEFLVCLVDNGFFTAAGIAYCEREKRVWLDTTDGRPKRFYAAKKDDLLQVSDLKHYL